MCNRRSRPFSAAGLRALATHLECVMATFGLVGVSSAYEQDFFRQFGHNADMVLTFGLQNERKVKSRRKSKSQKKKFSMHVYLDLFNFSHFLPLLPLVPSPLST